MNSWPGYLFRFLAGLMSEQKVHAQAPGVKVHVLTKELGSGYDREVEEATERDIIVNFMRSQLGKPYRLGAEVQPGKEHEAEAWDCSEETEAAYRLTTHVLPDGAQAQYDFCRPVKIPRHGDLSFLWSDKRKLIGHVMVYTSSGTVVHAVGGRGVVEDLVSMWENHPRWRGWRRHPDFMRPAEERV